MSLDNYDIEPEHITPTDADNIKIIDLPDKSLLEVSTVSDDNIYRIELEGVIGRDGDNAVIFMSHNWYRKYWDAPLGMAYHMDLMKRLLEFRETEFEDVANIEFTDDGDWCHLTYSISVNSLTTVGDVYRYGLGVVNWINDIVDDAQEKTGKLVASISSNYSQFKLLELPKLLERIENETDSHKKGRVLEELVYRFFSIIEGFEIIERLKTDTEEIDLVIINKSSSPFWQKESQLILVECKNWSTNCGKNELVVFKEKLANRRSRAKIGFFISWNGFTKTFSKEDLRSSQGDILIIPIDGSSLVAAINGESIQSSIESWWFSAVGT